MQGKRDFLSRTMKTGANLGFPRSQDHNYGKLLHVYDVYENLMKLTFRNMLIATI